MSVFATPGPSLSISARLSQLTPGEGFVTLEKVSPAGSLQGRREKNGGISLYWRYTFKALSERVLIGVYDSKLPPKSLSPSNGRFSLAAARRHAEDLASSHVQAKQALGGYRGLRKAEAIAKQQAEASARMASEQEALLVRAAKVAAEQALYYNLEELCRTYVGHLEQQGKLSSAYDAKNIFKNHVLKSAPALAALPAKEVQVEQVVELLRQLNEAGKGRTANKLRSYLESAYNNALRARFDPSVPAAFKGFAVSSNPITSTFRIRNADREAKHPLTTVELRKYWKQIDGMGGIVGATLRLHVSTGGQRIAQLVRLTKIDDLGNCIKLTDAKGRRSSPRSHLVPLVRSARIDLDFLKRQASGPFVFSTTGGEKPINPLTLTRWANQAATEAGIERFSAKRVRSGVETLLSGAGVSQDHRAQLQSHGLSGVQHRHYDGHDYHKEKVAALSTLMKILKMTSRKAKDGRASSRVSRPKTSDAIRRRMPVTLSNRVFEMAA